MTSPPYFFKELYGYGEGDTDHQAYVNYSFDPDVKNDMIDDGLDPNESEYLGPPGVTIFSIHYSTKAVSGTVVASRRTPQLYLIRL